MGRVLRDLVVFGLAIAAMIFGMFYLLIGCSGAGVQTIQQHEQLMKSSAKISTVAFLRANPKATPRVATVVGDIDAGLADGTIQSVELAVSLIDVALQKSKLDTLTQVAISELTATIVAEFMAHLQAMPEVERVKAYIPALRSVVGAVHEGVIQWEASAEYAAWRAKQDK